MDFNRIISGMIRAARLDVSFFEEVEHDESRSQDALIVVLIAAVAGAIGGFLGLLFDGRFGAAIGTLISSTLMSVITYFFWAFLIYIVGTRLFKGTAEFGEVQRTLGFAWAPQVLIILSFIPILGGIITFVAWIWSIVAGFVATRQSLDLDNTNTAFTVIIATIAGIIIQVVFGLIMGAIGWAGASVAGLF